jgi:peroxiredoxin
MLWVSECALWVLVFLLAAFLLGCLQAVSRLRWRIEQLEVVRPGRIGRSGLPPGTPAPDFSCPTLEGEPVSLAGLPGRVLLVFLKAGCKPCERIVPALNRLERIHNLQVVAVHHGEQERVRSWASRVGASFPVILENDRDLSRRYQVFAAPFAFLIDETKTIIGRGLIAREQHIEYVLEGN